METFEGIVVPNILYRYEASSVQAFKGSSIFSCCIFKCHYFFVLFIVLDSSTASILSYCLYYHSATFSYVTFGGCWKFSAVFFGCFATYI